MLDVPYSQYLLLGCYTCHNLIGIRLLGSVMEVLIDNIQYWLNETPLSFAVLMLTANAFLVYGIQIFVSQYMKEEFNRFGFNPYQTNLIGAVQILGGMGLIAGFVFPIIGMFTAFGFVLMMIIALYTRYKVKDKATRAIPAIVFFITNAWLCYAFYMVLNV